MGHQCLHVYVCNVFSTTALYCNVLYRWLILLSNPRAHSMSIRATSMCKVLLSESCLWVVHYNRMASIGTQNCHRWHGNLVCILPDHWLYQCSFRYAIVIRGQFSTSIPGYGILVCNFAWQMLLTQSLPEQTFLDKNVQTFFVPGGFRPIWKLNLASINPGNDLRGQWRLNIIELSINKIRL